MMHLLLSVSDGDLCYAHFPYLGHRGRGYFMLRPSEMEVSSYPQTLFASSIFVSYGFCFIRFIQFSILSRLMFEVSLACHLSCRGWYALIFAAP